MVETPSDHDRDPYYQNKDDEEEDNDEDEDEEVREVSKEEDRRSSHGMAAHAQEHAQPGDADRDTRDRLALLDEDQRGPTGKDTQHRKTGEARTLALRSWATRMQ